jgi:hypothetical protein
MKTEIELVQKSNLIPMKTPAQLLRRIRLEAEANMLRERLRNNGYKTGEPADFEQWPKEHIAWQARLWYIGFALHNPSMPEVP